MSKENKPEPNRIPGVPEDACGQQPHWPGDAALPPGEVKEGDSKTVLPNIPGPGDPNKSTGGRNNP